MSKAYIPKNTWVVFTYQQNPSPQKLIPTRAKRSVFYKKDLELLTIEDRNTNEKFICKSTMNFAMGLGGLIVGVILASNRKNEMLRVWRNNIEFNAILCRR